MTLGFRGERENKLDGPDEGKARRVLRELSARALRSSYSLFCFIVDVLCF